MTIYSIYLEIQSDEMTIDRFIIGTNDLKQVEELLNYHPGIREMVFGYSYNVLGNKYVLDKLEPLINRFNLEYKSVDYAVHLSIRVDDYELLYREERVDDVLAFLTDIKEG